MSNEPDRMPSGWWILPLAAIAVTGWGFAFYFAAQLVLARLV